MIPEYEKLLKVAVERKKENKSFFEKLKKIPGRDLDTLVHELHEKAFEQIDCLKCANCCKTTGPLLKNKDIERLSEHLRIKPANFVSEHLRIDEDNDYVFKKMPCTFLKEDNCCSVYSARPNACRQYPHTDQRDIRSILPLTYLNSMICPAVAFIIEELKGELKL
ncbi:MAG: YkgJ family cysteine cluster protein [Bacteroidia bacterium]|nr:YkgJ family cysteine cluster protein [Bacteroidia bacterium]